MTDLPGGTFIGSLVATSALQIGELKPTPQYLTIGDLVRISLDDGSIEYGDDYQPDEAARRFWQAMSTTYGNSLAAVERVRTIHHHVECSNVRCKTGGWCIGCDPTGSDDCSEHPWPCPTVLALDPNATRPDQYAAWVLKRDHEKLQAKLQRVRAFADADQDGLCCSHVAGDLRRLLEDQ